MPILFLTQVLPYPLDTGAKVRAYYVLRHLAQRHAVTLVSFTRAEDQPEHIAHLRSFCHAVHTVPMVRARRLDLLALPASLLRREPVIIARDAVPAMYALLEQVTGAGTFSAVHADQTSMVQYALAAADTIARRMGQRPRLVLDAHNALYKVVERLAAQERRPGVHHFLAWEAQRLARYEQASYRRFDQVVFVTAEDRERLGLPGAAVIPICADVASTPPVAHPAGAVRQVDAARVTFVGALHWPPNAQGIAWFAQAGWPTVYAAAPHARLSIAGKAAPPALAALAASLPGVELLGYVADLTPLLAATAVFVVPLLAGGGMRVKIVDAWRWGVPVVATTVGAEGIDYTPGVELLLADSPADFAAAVLRVLGDPALGEALTAAGRRRVLECYDWRSVYRAWDGVYALGKGDKLA